MYHRNQMQKLLLLLAPALMLFACGEKPAISDPPESTDAFPVTDAFRYEAGEPEIGEKSDTLCEISFYRDDLKIAGQLYLPEGEGPFPLAVISSGQTASCSYYADEARYFAGNGCACLIFDFTGAVARSMSSGELQDSSVLTEAADLNVILDSLPSLPKIDTGHVFLWGHSLGGLVSTYVGCSRPEDISGMSQVPEVIYDTSLYNTVVGKQFVIDMQSVDIFSMMPKCDKDVLIFVGTENCLGSSIPEYFERAEKTFPSAEVVTVQGADHFFQGEHGQKAAEQSLAFIRAHL